LGRVPLASDLIKEESLDPADWEAFRRLGHRMVDDVVTYLQTVRERPAWQSPPEAVRARLQAAVPLEPQGAEQAYEDFLRDVLPYPTGNVHPRFWGWVIGTGTPFAALAEMLAGAMNASVSVFDDAPRLVERQVIGWLKELLGFPVEGSGLLTTGASAATILGLAVARHARAGYDVRRRGVAAGERRLTLYASSESHGSIAKAVELLGLGRESLRLVPVDTAFEIDVAALEKAVAEDRAAGLRPFCVIGTAGTVNTGAIDDLNSLAGLCEREGLWLHVDGAFGAMAALAPALRLLLRGLERADSVAFDLHKWGYLPLEVGCVLVKNAEAHRATFASEASYLTAIEGGTLESGDRFADYGHQLSREFRALKVWLSLKEHGAAKIGRLIQQNVDQARYVADLVERAPGLELLSPVSLNVVCFRYRGNGPVHDLDDLNRRILVTLQKSGVAVPSNTTIRGRLALRLAITNHRSRRDDFDLLVSEVVRLGKALERQA
jgi:glutamate/tyrosine decarboxylase-like PLP-dependent enzyme